MIIPYQYNFRCILKKIFNLNEFKFCIYVDTRTLKIYKTAYILILFI